MTKHELITAYVGGRIGRRDFVRGLTALGVSASAAGAYALSLTPGASAAGVGRDRAGLRVRTRYQVYGASAFGSDAEAVQLLSQFADIQIAILEAGLANLKAAPLRAQAGVELDPADVDELQTLHTQLVEHRDALRALASDLGDTPVTVSIPEFAYDNAEDLLTDLRATQETQLGIYAAVLPDVTDRNASATLVSIGLVQGRHAAFVNRLLKDSPFPETFQSPATPEEVDQSLGDLGS